MIVPDTNLLLYAYNDGSPYYSTARPWWEDLVNGPERIDIPWVVAVALVRLIINPSAIEFPMSPLEAVENVRGWFEYPQIAPLNPGPNHLIYFQRNMEAVGIGRNLAPDAHIAALAMEHEAELHSNDSDFGRFPGLRWRNPLQSEDGQAL